MVAKQYRLQEWVNQIQDCKNRPARMRVADWCDQNGITRANYYYCLKKVREACLENIPDEILPQAVVTVSSELMKQMESEETFQTDGLDLSFHGISIHVTEKTSMKLLTNVLEAVRHAE